MEVEDGGMKLLIVEAVGGVAAAAKGSRQATVGVTVGKRRWSLWK